jgi:teichuronic acid biosynthesis glycosyltransferase TuaG
MIVNEPLVSIITPAYNVEKYIGVTIDSVLNQVYGNWEMLIVDDCSNDNTREIITKYVNQDERIKLITFETNSGHPSVPRNEGIKNAVGKYIAFLDSDDIWFPEKLSIQIGQMEKGNLIFSHMSYNICDESGKLTGKSFRVRNRMKYHDLLKVNGIGCLTAVYNAHELGKLYFKPNVGQEDFIYWIQICEKIGEIVGLDEIQSIYRIRDNSVSSNKLKMAYANWKIYFEHLNLNFFQALYYFTVFSFNWFYRKIK